MCGNLADHMDHVKPLAAGGSQWPSNQRPACWPCNFRKGARWPYPPQSVAEENYNPRDFCNHPRKVIRRVTVTHWLTTYDPEDGEPIGSLCWCDIDHDHDGKGEYMNLLVDPDT
jgi:hypothetical protein